MNGSRKSLLDAFSGKRVWISGVTGFKGSWLAEWLLSLGATVTGFSLPPPTSPSLFEQLELASRIQLQIGDVRNPGETAQSLLGAEPDFVFHLAAQPLVRLSYKTPVETWETNVQGTIHVLEALRQLSKPCAAVLITTDKCYRNREWLYAYREEDPLGGHDPYSSSKAAAEIAIASWRDSFFFNHHPVKLASARAGNVIGGGDWAEDRIVPDCIRALKRGTVIPVRNKTATRPWQHVLEPLSGYLMLAARLANVSTDRMADFCSPFNFGPNLSSNQTVAELVQEMVRHWPGSWEDQSDPNAPHEAGKLNLSTDKAFHLMGWKPKWDFAEAIEKTAVWYRDSQVFRSPEEFQRLTQCQIREYEAV